MNISLFNSTMAEDPDLEDGEIEDDEEEDDCVVVAVMPSEPPKPVEKEPSPQKKKSADSYQNKKSTTTSSTSRKDEGKDKHQNPDEDDFMSKIENALAEGLKRSGIEPPMPNIKKQEQEPGSECRSTRKNRKRKKTRQEQREQSKARKEQKRKENVARVSERFECCALATTCLVSETIKNQRERRILHDRRESRSVGQRVRSRKQQQLRLRGVPSKQL